MRPPEPVRASDELTCDVCGRFGAYAFDGRTLCEDCCATAGTCGAGGSESDEPDNTASP